jgi:tetratricopeptide (TPR) repeat protein
MSHLIALMLLSFLLCSCGAKPARVAAPDRAAIETQVRQLLSTGDSTASKEHLFGWLEAEALYRKAYELQGSEAIRDRLLLIRFLIETRQADEDLPDPPGGLSLASLCSPPLTPRQKLLCELGSMYVAGKFSEGADALDISALDSEASALDAYIRTLAVRTWGIREDREVIESRRERFRDSPLFVYLELGREVAQRGAELEKSHADFAELFTFVGYGLFQNQRYSGARAYFRKALDLIPGYTRAHIGLGNVCLFALEDSEKALVHYQGALAFDPRSTAALFGKGTALHNLGRFAESTAEMDLVLQSDISRRGRANAQSVRYYRGEATFYKALNQHELRDDEKARELVDAAKQIIPNSEGVNYLSGLLFYNRKMYREAKDDFERVLQSGNPNCDAQYYLGHIYRRWKDDPPENTGFQAPQELQRDSRAREKLEQHVRQLESRFAPESNAKRALSYFLGACACMESSVKSASDRIARIPALELDPSDKVILKGRLENRLFNYRVSAVPMVEEMIRTSSDLEAEDAKSYTGLMADMLTRIRP